MEEKFSAYVKSIIDQDITLTTKMALIQEYGNRLLSEEYHKFSNLHSNDD